MNIQIAFEIDYQGRANISKKVPKLLVPRHTFTFYHLLPHQGLSFLSRYRSPRKTLHPFSSVSLFYFEASVSGAHSIAGVAWGDPRSAGTPSERMVKHHILRCSSWVQQTPASLSCWFGLKTEECGRPSDSGIPTNPNVGQSYVVKIWVKIRLSAGKGLPKTNGLVAWHGRHQHHKQQSAQKVSPLLGMENRSLNGTKPWWCRDGSTNGLVFPRTPDTLRATRKWSKFGLANVQKSDLLQLSFVWITSVSCFNTTQIPPQNLMQGALQVTNCWFSQLT